MSAPERLPGDPAAVRRTGRDYEAVAQALHEAAAEIRRLSAETSTARSGAVAALASTAGDVADRLGKLDTRYEVAGSALQTYAGKLEEAQESASAAKDAYDAALEQRSRGSRWAEHYRDAERAAVDEAEREDAASSRRSWEREEADADAAMRSAIDAYEGAVAHRDSAAEKAREAIDEAVESDGMNDSWWDNVSGWVSEHAELLKGIKNVMSWVTTALAVASFFLPVLAPFALAAAAITVGMSGLLAAAGEISWTEFGLDSLALVTAGVGAVAGKVVSRTVTSLKQVRVANVAATATTKSPVRVVTGSFNGVQPARVTVQQKGRWAIEVMRADGVANAKAARIFTRAVAGRGGAADDVLVQRGLTWLTVARGASATNWSTTLAQHGLTQVEDPDGLISDVVTGRGQGLLGSIAGIDSGAPSLQVTSGGGGR